MQEHSGGAKDMTTTHRRPWQAGRTGNLTAGAPRSCPYHPSPTLTTIHPYVPPTHPGASGGCQLPVSPHLFLLQLSVGLRGFSVEGAAFGKSPWMCLSTPGDGRVLTLWLSTCPLAFISVQSQSLTYCLSGRATVRGRRKPTEQLSTTGSWSSDLGRETREPQITLTLTWGLESHRFQPEFPECVPSEHLGSLLGNL